MKNFPSSSHESISRRAHDLWLSQGSPEGQDLEHWLQAESEITASSARVIDVERLQEFLDSFGNTGLSRGPTSLNFT